MLVFCSKSNGVGGSGGYLGGLGIIRLHVRQIEQRNTTGLSFVLSRILFCFFLRRLASFNFNMAFFVSWGDKLQNVNILSFSIIWHLQGDNGGIIALFFNHQSTISCRPLNEFCSNRVFLFLQSRLWSSSTQHVQTCRVFFIVSFIGIDQNAIRFSLRNNMIQSNKVCGWRKQAMKH